MPAVPPLALSLLQTWSSRLPQNCGVNKRRTSERKDGCQTVHWDDGWLCYLKLGLIGQIEDHGKIKDSYNKR